MAIIKKIQTDKKEHLLIENPDIHIRSVKDPFDLKELKEEKQLLEEDILSLSQKKEQLEQEFKEKQQQLKKLSSDLQQQQFIHAFEKPEDISDNKQKKAKYNNFSQYKQQFFDLIIAPIKEEACSLIKHRKTLQDEVQHMQKKVDFELSKTHNIAQKNIQDMMLSAEEEAKIIKQQAKFQADHLLEKSSKIQAEIHFAQYEQSSLNEEILRLRQQKESLLGNMFSEIDNKTEQFHKEKSILLKEVHQAWQEESKNFIKLRHETEKDIQHKLARCDQEIQYKQNDFQQNFEKKKTDAEKLLNRAKENANQIISQAKKADTTIKTNFGLNSIEMLESSSQKIIQLMQEQLKHNHNNKQQLKLEYQSKQKAMDNELQKQKKQAQEEIKLAKHQILQGYKQKVLSDLQDWKQKEERLFNDKLDLSQNKLKQKYLLEHKKTQKALYQLSIDYTKTKEALNKELHTKMEQSKKQMAQHLSLEQNNFDLEKQELEKHLQLMQEQLKHSHNKKQQLKIEYQSKQKAMDNELQQQQKQTQEEIKLTKHQIIQDYKQKVLSDLQDWKQKEEQLFNDKLELTQNKLKQKYLLEHKQTQKELYQLSVDYTKTKEALNKELHTKMEQSKKQMAQWLSLERNNFDLEKQELEKHLQLMQEQLKHSHNKKQQLELEYQSKQKAMDNELQKQKKQAQEEIKLTKHQIIQDYKQKVRLNLQNWIQQEEEQLLNDNL